MSVITQEVNETSNWLKDDCTIPEDVIPLYGRSAHVIAFVYELAAKQIEVPCRETRNGTFYLLNNEHMKAFKSFKEKVTGLPMVIDDAVWQHYMQFVDAHINKAHLPVCPEVITVTSAVYAAFEEWKLRVAPLPSPPLRCTEESVNCSPMQ